ncbi:winged helix-turn-helix domain-containing protein [Streptomyces sp. NPDC057746]|uniref:winged helix-turn-helix domain-containing protein n=1 Tax=Streptomyces sp. NPDC057746 TaxID=3346237 RepID=UPI0036A58F8D
MGTLIGRRFHVSCSIAGAWRLPHRHGWSWQSRFRRVRARRTSRRAVEEGRVSAGGSTAAALGAWAVFEDEARFAMPRTCTWSRRGHTSVVRVRGHRLGERARPSQQPRPSERWVWPP